MQARICFLSGLFLLTFVWTNHSFTQTTPFLNDDEIRMLTNEISGDRAYEHIRWLSHWHRNSGMEGYFKAVDYVLKAAKEAGLEDVKFIEQPLRGPNYTAHSAELWMVEPVEVKLADIGDHAILLSDGSHDADVTTELVWIGDGSRNILEDVDVKGKIVLIKGNPGTAVRNAVWGKGAAGVISYSISEGKSMLDFPDQIAWTRIPIFPPEGKSGTFAFNLPPRRGEMLRELLQTKGKQDIFKTGKRTEGGRVVVHAKVDTEIGEMPGKTGFVEGWIRGTKYHDQQIVVTAHLQEEQGSANDDGSGCGNILELARTFTKLIREGKMQRPLRDIRFWWTDEIYSEYRYFMDYPDEPKKMLANLHQDMTGAYQAMGSRVQHLIFAPHSISSYLDALFESIGTYVIQTNNAFLAASRQGGLPRPHTRPIYSTRGTRDGYNAAFVPYFDSSDHMCFIDGAIGVPAIGMVNWDDFYIHSSDDDLGNIDQTQLQRNNFIVGAMAYFLSQATPSDVPTLTSETYAQCSRRLANDLKVSMQHLVNSKKEPSGGWKEASIILEQGIERDVRALQSIEVFTESDQKTKESIDKFVDLLMMKEKELNAALKTFYRQIHGRDPGKITLTDAEKEADRKIPANVDNLEDYFGNRNRARFRSGLHGLMRDEVFNFVDGEKSYYDIYKAVLAEAMAAGKWYYGTVTLDGVVGLLDAGVEAGALTLK